MTTTEPRVHGCWRVIGRPGPGTCPELARAVLCRNCDHYASVALQLLERDVPADYTREWTEHLALPAATVAARTSSVTIFRLGAEWFALASTAVDEVMERVPVHTLPHRGEPVRGLVSVRGELVVCVSLHAVLRAETSAMAEPEGKLPRMLILDGAGGRIAFEPDEIGAVHRYAAAELVASPVTLSRSAAVPFTLGLIAWKEHAVGVLDAERLLTTIGRSLS